MKTKEETEQLHLEQLNAVLRGMSSHQIEAAIAAELKPLLGGSSGWRTQNVDPTKLYNARQRALQTIAETEMVRCTAEAEAREAALGTPDDRARARVLRIHAAKLDQRLATMTPADRAVWDQEVAICRAGLDSARVRSAAGETKVFSDRLDALGAVPPAEGDLEALLEVEGHAWGVDLASHQVEVARLKTKHNLGDDLKPRTTRKTASARR